MFQTTISKEGRVLIPAELRRALGLEPNDTLNVYERDGEIRIVSRLHAIRQMQSRMAKYRKAGDSAVDELIQERREASARE